MALFMTFKKKVKIETSVGHKLVELYDKRWYLRTKDDEESLMDLQALEEELVKKYADKMYKKVKAEVKVMNNEEALIQVTYRN